MADRTIKPYSDPRWWKDAGGNGAFCNHCKHNHMDFTCAAYPDGIPWSAFVEVFKDNKPNEVCANGIGYKFDPGKPFYGK